MKISKRLSTKYRIVKAYNEKQRFKSSSATPALGDHPYRNLVIAGHSNTLRTGLGLAVLVNHVRNNPMLRFGKPNYVFLSRMEGPIALRLWEYIQGRDGLDSTITDQINKRVLEMYDVDDAVTPSGKDNQFSTAEFFLGNERTNDVTQWFLSKGYTLKISDYWCDDIGGILNIIRDGRFVIRYNDDLTSEGCRQRLLFSLNCSLISTVHLHKPMLINEIDCVSVMETIRPIRALLNADRAVLCGTIKPTPPSTEYKRMTELIKNRGGKVGDRGPQSTVDLINALIK